jgi:uncharacterized linocin/CFP29 family protein
MAYGTSPIPWTDDQWARIEDVIQREARSARVAASFLPLFGPLPPDADFVQDDTLTDGAPGRVGPRGRAVAPPTFPVINDRGIRQLATLQVEVQIRGAQIADPELSSALQLFRRSANVLARLEDLVVFRGLVAGPALPPAAVLPLPPPGAPPLGAPLPPQPLQPPGNWQITGGSAAWGLYSDPRSQDEIVPPIVPPRPPRPPAAPPPALGPLGIQLVDNVSGAIRRLEWAGHFGPFALVLGPEFFQAVQTPSPSLALPQDSIIPFLGGGPLLRSSALDEDTGLVVALGGAAVDLVVARDMSVDFLTTTLAPEFIFRVSEKIVLRIKQPTAICRLRY